MSTKQRTGKNLAPWFWVSASLSLSALVHRWSTGTDPLHHLAYFLQFAVLGLCLIPLMQFESQASIDTSSEGEAPVSRSSGSSADLRAHALAAFRLQGFTVATPDAGTTAVTMHRGADAYLVHFKLECAQVSFADVHQLIKAISTKAVVGGYIVADGVPTPYAATLAARHRIDILSGPLLARLLQASLDDSEYVGQRGMDEAPSHGSRASPPFAA
jgi:hypothetical protein